MALLISKAGLNTKRKEIESLKQKLNDLRIFKGSVAIHSGDAWHDNNDFEQSEIEERRILKQINDLSAEIASATIVEDTSCETDIVKFGSKVLIKLSEDNEDIMEEIILFSDSDEASELMKVSANSPLGKTIYNQKVGFTGSYTVDNISVFTVKILKIE